MSETKHTPGPWSYGGPTSIVDLAGAKLPCREIWKATGGGYWIAQVAALTAIRWKPELKKVVIAEAEANARLIAAAPELLEALCAARENIDLTYRQYWPEGRDKEDLSSTPPLLERIDVAIAKAEGR